MKGRIQLSLPKIEWMRTLLCFLLIPSALWAQLASGPMIGHTAMREANIWVQTQKPATVQVRYWPVDLPTNKNVSPAVKTAPETAHVAKLVAALLEPGVVYKYEVLVDGQPVALPYPTQFTTQSLWQHRTDPPAFNFLTGSCFYVNEEAYDRPGTPYGGDYRLVESMNREEAGMMLWLGDNTYLREADWDSRSGIFHRFSHSRATKELQPLLARMAHYAIWDDHDHGPNDSDRSYPLRETTLEAFNLFWANPSSNATGQGGITTQFRWYDCDFFLLDNRWFRSAPDTTGQIIGEAQMQWLMEALQFSTATFKFVAIGGQVVNNAAVYENHAVFAHERLALLDHIDKLNLRNVVFLTGDRHHSELSRLVTPSGVVVHDLTVSPLTSSAVKEVKEINNHRVEGSLFNQRNYALVGVSGKRKERVLNIQLKDANGQLLWQHEIKPQGRKD